MNARPVLPRRPVSMTLAAAALSILVTLGLLNAVAGLFLRDGMPLEQLVIAEHACADYSFVSERATCMRAFLGAPRIASR